MKKSTKIILASVAGVLALTGLIFVADSLNHTELQGYTFVSFGQGTGTYDFKKNELYMAPNTESTEKYYSYCGDDGIYNIKYEYVENSYYEISFNDDFNISDDMQVYFRLATEDWSWDDLTPIAKSHVAVGRQKIKITKRTFVRRYLYIVEAWVRTVD